MGTRPIMAHSTNACKIVTYHVRATNLSAAQFDIVPLCLNDFVKMCAAVSRLERNFSVAAIG